VRNPESLRWWFMAPNTIRLIRKNIFLVLILSFFALTIACESEPICTTNNVSLVRISFLKIGETRRNDTLYSVSIVAENDSLLYLNDTITQLVLPVNPAVNASDFYFLRNARIDTLRIGYNIEQLFISDECGFDQRYSELNVPSTSFDSVRIRKDFLERNNDVNIEIYRCVNENTANINAAFVQTQAGEKVLDTVFYANVYDNLGNEIFTNAALSTFLLPVHPGTRQLQYYFERLSNGNPEVDTLTVDYVNFPEQIAPPCPVQIRYDSLKIDDTLSSFDSVTVLKKHLSIPNGRNIEIFSDQ
jgi:hypothetical protein